MSAIIILTLSIAVGLWALRYLNRLIDGDGLGQRKPPPSYPEDVDPATGHWHGLAYR